MIGEALSKADMYREGYYSMRPPPVNHNSWRDADWMRHIDNQNGWWSREQIEKHWAEKRARKAKRKQERSAFNRNRHREERAAERRDRINAENLGQEYTPAPPVERRRQYRPGMKPLGGRRRGT